MIQPGLERIGQLLKNVTFPWKSIHVAGTNGKGSICHHASALLTRSQTRVGKFTSPHLIDRWDCLAINEMPVDPAKFLSLEQHYQQLSRTEGIDASPFEILTATAFHLFNDEKIEVGIVEVGMGGKLDATNILNNQAFSVISKIARDHESFLGNSLQEIAKHKAGILRPNVPYIVNPMNEFHVQDVIDEYAKEIGAGPRLSGDTPEYYQTLYNNSLWRRFATPLQPFQRDNAVLAVVAVQETLASMKKKIKESTIRETLFKYRRKANKGRLSTVHVQPVFGSPSYAGRDILVDGAHNPDAAAALEQYVYPMRRKGMKRDDTVRHGQSVTWVLAMSEGKNAEAYLRTLLKPHDNVVTTSFDEVDGMPWVKPMDPKELLNTAKSACRNITGIAMPRAGTFRALCAAKYLANHDGPIVLTGSLYLVGNLYRDIRSMYAPGTLWWNSPDIPQEQAMMRTMHQQENSRVNRLLSGQDPDVPGGTYAPELRIGFLKEEAEKKKIQEELDALDRELEQLEIQERQVSPSPTPDSAFPSTIATDRMYRRRFDPSSDELPFSDGPGPRPRIIYKNPDDKTIKPRANPDYRNLHARNRELKFHLRDDTKQDEVTDREVTDREDRDLQTRNRDLVARIRTIKRTEDTKRRDWSERRLRNREKAIEVRPKIRMFYSEDVKAPQEDVVAPQGDAHQRFSMGKTSSAPRGPRILRYGSATDPNWSQRGSRASR